MPDMPDLAFLLVSAVTIISAVLALESKEVIYGAVSLGISFLGVAGFFVLLDAPFLALFQIIVYVGAIAVLILFTVMLVRREKWLHARGGPERVVGVSGALALALGAGFLALQSGLQEWQAKPDASLPFTQIGEQIVTVYWPVLWVLAFALAASVMGALALARAERK